MAYDFLVYDVADRIATITVNRPDKLNALNDATIAELGRAIDAAVADPAVAGVILTGAGRAFVAGADIGELSTQTPMEAIARARRGQAVFDRFEQSPKPVVAAVNGFALGGGCELAMACHVRIAADVAKFGQPEVKLGILPGYGGTQRLPRLVGTGRALQLLMTAEMIGADEAYRIGLVNAVVPVADVVEAARALLRQMLANGPLAVAACIDAVVRGQGMTLPDALAYEAVQFGALAATDDVKEGMQAFLGKRAPTFGGR
ncbi:MAG: enoyl-CoA hydratase-related protein [Gemmatimonadaceae bacterium]|jgi:enoyl-CoA hydratase|nr:enoyl-CoA hydratase-related protein [Gemmatimonadaceae bacterium]